MNYCGIDLGSKTSAVCVQFSTDKILRGQMIPTDSTGFSQGLQSFSRLRCVVEEAAPLAEWIARLLEEFGHEVVVIDSAAPKP
jgi:transposase